MLGVLIPLRCEFVAFNLFEIVDGKVVKGHGFGSFDLVLHPLGTRSVSYRLLLIPRVADHLWLDVKYPYRSPGCNL